MAVDTGGIVLRYARGADAFNRNDLEAFGDLFTEDCPFQTLEDGTAWTGRAEIVEGLRRGREAGWTSHNVLQIVAMGDFVVSIFRNEFADGSSVTGVGVLLVNAEGQVSKVCTHNGPREAGG